MPRRTRSSRGPAFTVEFPEALPVGEREGDHWWAEVDGRRLRLSNLDKVFWPKEGYTKGDLLAYYFNSAHLIVPYLAGRPLTMKRMPDGAEGPFFYEKDAPRGTPDWLPRCRVQSEDKVINYLMAEDRPAVLFVANLGCIEFHPLHSTCGRIGVPDYLFFDLDPFPPATFEDVLITARHVHAVLGTLGLRGYPKTSGATGMQIFVPIEPRFTYDQVRDMVGKIGHAIRRADPERVTMQWEVDKRRGVFVDHNMNREGANIAAVYSVRPEPGATVSTPLTWEEVEQGGIEPGDFRIDNVWERFDGVGDLFARVLSEPQDISAALESLGIEPEAAEPTSWSEPTRADGGVRGGSSEEVIARSKDPKLGEYLKKRDFAATPEPAGGDDGDQTRTGNAFVIQKHRATRLHYDLRLERDGVMVSWAVPKGLPLERGNKRLAVHVEDHPIEYNEFEGTIPKGHYGAGEVRIFDRGTYEPLEWTDKKVSFRLHGERYRGGEWHLVKTATDWLAILSKPGEIVGHAPLPSYMPMLAEAGHDPFDDPKWRFEPKLDGVRSLIYVEKESTRLVSRTGRDQTGQYPELGAIHEVVTALTAVLDGEIVAVGPDGRASFELLQQRINLSSKAEIERTRRKIPVTCYAFDLLFVDGEDLTERPLTERRARLEEVFVPGGPLGLTVVVEGEGRAFYESARQLGMEGVIAKRAAGRYLPGKRSGDWRKIKILNRQDCVVLGWTPGSGSRSSTFGALLVGAYERPGGELRWIGQVGTGFTEKMLDDLLERLGSIRRDSPPIEDRELARVKGARFVEPALVCEVEYLQITEGRKLRAPSYKGLRPDKAPEDCILEPPAGATDEPEARGRKR